jgi:hypothetical protein
MSLEKEAQDFMGGKQRQFKDGLDEGITNLEQYLIDNLYNSFEKDEAMKNLIEVQMWAERGAKMYGIK